MTTRVPRAEALERWADAVDADDLVEAKTAALRTIAELVEQRDDLDTASTPVQDTGSGAHIAQRVRPLGPVLGERTKIGAPPVVVA